VSFATGCPGSSTGTVKINNDYGILKHFRRCLKHLAKRVQLKPQVFGLGFIVPGVFSSHKEPLATRGARPQDACRCSDVFDVRGKSQGGDVSASGDCFASANSRFDRAVRVNRPK
jgi:hypothetical protein